MIGAPENIILAKNDPPKHRVNRIEYLNNNSHADTQHRVWEHYYFLSVAGCVIRGWLEWGVELSATAEREGANA